MAKNKQKVLEQAIAVIEDKVEFDVWYVLREAKIPKHHHKEIIKADFKGQGLSDHETMAVFDAALKKYGLML